MRYSQAISFRLRLVHILLFLFIAGMPALPAQIIDRIVAIVGDEVILSSDVENQLNYYILNGRKDDGSLRCQVMEELIISKLLLNKAMQDSIVVMDEEVDMEVDRRVGYLLSQMGGDTDEFQRIYGKPVPQFKADINEDIRKELLIDRQRSTILAEADITPKEVKSFFRSINPDSLGFLPAEVQLNHIVIRPPVSEESEREARNFLRDLRKQIIENDLDFGEQAGQYSEEPGASRSKGDLGEFGRGMMVPAFEEVVFQMRPGEISKPFRTEFGYHIVQLLERRGEVVHARHILRRLQSSANGDQVARDSLNNIRQRVLDDSLSFEHAAILYSEDRASKDCGGCIVNPQTRELRIPLDALDADLYFKVEDMKKGEISEPLELRQPDGTKAWHIIYLKNKLPPHSPNLKDDYQKIRNAAMQNKQAIIFENWLESAQRNIFIEIKPTECSNALSNWVN